MRKQIYLTAAVTVAALAIVFWGKSSVLSAPIAPAHFVDRWAPVDEALRLGKFVVKYSDVDTSSSATKPAVPGRLEPPH